jgi:hypothetical protein
LDDYLKKLEQEIKQRLKDYQAQAEAGEDSSLDELEAEVGSLDDGLDLDELEPLTWADGRAPLIKGWDAISDYLAGEGGYRLSYQRLRELHLYYGLPTIKMPGDRATYAHGDHLDRWWQKFCEKQAEFTIKYDAIEKLLLVVEEMYWLIKQDKLASRKLKGRALVAIREAVKIRKARNKYMKARDQASRRSKKKTS